MPARYAGLTLKDEIVFLGWQDGAVPAHLRAMFDDFCDSSELGMRYVVPGDMLFSETLDADGQKTRTRLLPVSVQTEQYQST